MERDVGVFEARRAAIMKTSISSVAIAQADDTRRAAHHVLHMHDVCFMQELAVRVYVHGGGNDDGGPKEHAHPQVAHLNWLARSTSCCCFRSDAGDFATN
eukprot:1160803-Pelagomonas_calceolata.AAC.9